MSPPPAVPASQRHPCPCCGHRTLVRPAGFSGQLCEVCLFEDRERAEGGLAAAQRAVEQHGVVDPDLAELARPPRPDEVAPPWFVAHHRPGPLLDAIDAAFAGVGLDGGVSLAEAELIDDYALPARDETSVPPPGHADAGPWTELDRAALEVYPWCNFHFQDARGLRYHLPAYLRLHLAEPDTFVDLGPLVFTLQQHHRLHALEELLTGDQARAVARFLVWLDQEEAWMPETGPLLEHRWARHLEPDQRWDLGW